MTRSRSLWAVVVSLFTAPIALTAPADRLPKCPPGWRVEVVAAVPKILHPSVVCCAPDGRVFMAEDPMDLGNDSTKPTDRVLCFHPDGRVTVFAENLHAGGSEGGDVGPDLGGVGAKYNRHQLIESVLYPSRQILDGYQQTRVVTAEGKVFSGSSAARPRPS